MKALLSGNEAIARGAYEGGVLLAAGYPGTPSTEILENIAKYKEIHAEWSPNEKVALEVAMGASFGGARSLVAMKHVGLNVAADPLFTFSYSGLQGGCVIVTCDDPGLYSSQNEQDNRNYAKFAKIPLLEPSDSQEAKDFLKLGLDISERFDTPLLLRTTTRISHSKSLVELEEREEPGRELHFTKNPQKYVMIPTYALERHKLVERRLIALSEYSNRIECNRIEWKDRRIGIITSGVAYQYVKEVNGDFSILKLGMGYPLPKKLIMKFAQKIQRLYVVEELDPFLEEQIRALGLKVIGKKRFSPLNELNPELVEKGLLGYRRRKPSRIYKFDLPLRPPVMCPGCPHRGVFYTLKKLKLIVTGDIGCYTLSALPPLEAMDTCICMGAGIGHAFGLEKALQERAKGKVVAVIGDSTFIHSGITEILNIVYNKGVTTVIILDNKTTAMTGRQDHPGTGYTLKKGKTKKLNLKRLVKAIGVHRVQVVNPYNLKETERAIEEEVNAGEPSVIIANRPCILIDKGKERKAFKVNSETCKACGLCLELGCPALSQKIDNNQAQGNRHQARKKVEIDKFLCNGCGLCLQVCKFKAIEL